MTGSFVLLVIILLGTLSCSGEESGSGWRQAAADGANTSRVNAPGIRSAFHPIARTNISISSVATPSCRRLRAKSFGAIPINDTAVVAVLYAQAHIFNFETGVTTSLGAASVTPVIMRNNTILLVEETLVTVYNADGKQLDTLYLGDRRSAVSYNEALDVAAGVFMFRSDYRLQYFRWSLEEKVYRVLWSVTVEATFYGKPAIGTDGTVYLPINNQVRAYSATDGRVLWNADKVTLFESSPTIDDTEHLLYTPLNGALLIQDTKTGDSLGDIRLPGIPQFASLSYSGYVVMNSGYTAACEVAAVNTMNNATVWTFEPYDQKSCGAPSVTKDGVVYVTSDTTLYALDIFTGDILWHHVHSSRLDALVEGIQVSVTRTGVVFVTGRGCTVWRYELPNQYLL